MTIDSQQSTIIISAPGKINLTLEILGKRPDGYHELRSILLPVSLCETVTVTARTDDVVTCRAVGEGVDVAELDTLPLEKQLVIKALRVMQRLCGMNCGADINIVKRVPIGAGMGGGSADAAGVMRALCELWKPQIFKDALLAAAAEIGSDVPALLCGGAVLMEGRGERVTSLGDQHSSLHLVMAFPGFPVSTKRVYENFGRGGRAARPNRESLGLAGRSPLPFMCNDLEPTVFRLYPEILRVRDLLVSCGATAAMVSGSGSALFGLAESADHAREIQSCLPASLWTRVVTTLP